jgi:hypothetical protein
MRTYDPVEQDYGDDDYTESYTNTTRSSRSNQGSPGSDRGYIDGSYHRYTDDHPELRKLKPHELKERVENGEYIPQWPPPRSFRIDYQDPFKTMSAYAWADLQGESEPKPQIVVWQGDSQRLQDRIPADLLGKRWSGSKRGSNFDQIGSFEVKCDVLSNHTHWGFALNQLIKKRGPIHDSFIYDANGEINGDHEVVSQQLSSFAKLLWKRIKALLRGDNDPVWEKRKLPDLGVIFEDPGILADKTMRAQRFIELLKTVDGIFTSRYIAFPEEVWNWTKYDLFTINSISHLIGDEFFDRVLSEGLGTSILSTKTSYENLKDYKKSAKLYLHSQSVKQGNPEWPEQAPYGWLSSFHKVVRHVSNFKPGGKQANAISYLCQTRCAGQPPKFVQLKSKMKTLLAFNVKPDALKPGVPQIIHVAVEKICSELPDEAVTGLATKAAVTASSNSCWEKTRAEDGTVEAIKDIILGYKSGDHIPMYDLNTMEHWYVSPDDISMGTYIFWASWKVCLSMDPDELNSVMLAQAVEPGKARTVTKGRACMKIVLDVINHLCSWPMAKGMRSSSSGMIAAHHAWNTFKAFYETDHVKTFFDVVESVNTDEDKSCRVDIKYKDIYSSSTDYKMATDYFHHEVGNILASSWMRRVGLPKALVGFVHRLCLCPRWVYFTANGPLNKVGEPSPVSENIFRRRIRLHQGILMGDPLTKILLHLLNASVRVVAENSCNQQFFESHLRNSASVVHQAITVLTMAREA